MEQELQEQNNKENNLKEQQPKEEKKKEEIDPYEYYGDFITFGDYIVID